MTATNDGSWMFVPGVAIGPLEDRDGESIDIVDFEITPDDRAHAYFNYPNVGSGGYFAFGLSSSEARRIAARLIEAAEFVEMRTRQDEEYCPHCGAGPADAEGELPHFLDYQDDAESSRL